MPPTKKTTPAGASRTPASQSKASKGTARVTQAAATVNTSASGPATGDTPASSAKTRSKSKKNPALIVIGHMLDVNGIKRPASYVKVILDPDPISPFDVLSLLSRSVHIKDFVKLVFGFSKVRSLSTSLRRVASFLRSSDSFQSITFLYAIENSPFPAPNVQKEVVEVFQELFDAVFSKPIKQIIFQGTPGHVGQFYQFRKDLNVPQTATLRSKLLKGVRKYLGRSMAKLKEGSRDAVVLDDKRYKQSPRLKPRIQPLRYTHPDVTNLAYLTIAGLDFLCPPFSQWIYPMLNASKLQHFRLVFQSRPTDLEEVKFILRRLALAMPHLPKLRLHDFQSNIQTLGVLMEGISAFANLEFLVMQTDPTPSDKLKLKSDLERLQNDLKIGLESSSSSAGTKLKSPPTFKFLPESRLRRIVASPDDLEFLVATTIGSDPQNSKLLPCLESVKILYTFDGMTRFSPENLAKCLKSIKVLAPETISVRLDFKNKDCLEFPKLMDNGHGVSDGSLDSDVLNIRKEISQVGELDIRLPKTRGEMFADLKETGVFYRLFFDLILLFCGIKFVAIVPADRYIDCDLQMGLNGRQLGPIFVNSNSRMTLMWF
ncbi:hypothetical protein EST38_g11957 [Candolleomyces aberdarensis]|uniref:Uncharacterized protein n=1 Tax=Candolleomyces aberdarensis TaxID=2316362 RepID=A0A4Q2D6W8_9AGAR|nr:hypothetical protein EST38_g11957 [Candolleomyces aberdarensis]